MIADDRFPRVEIRSRAQLREWLAKHHARRESVWLVTWRKLPGAPYVSRDEVLDELLCFGWIDGIRRKIDDRRTMQLVSPRRTDAWTSTYRARAARLVSSGLMRPPGRRAMQRAQTAGLWIGDPDVDALRVPPDLRRALDARAGASDWFARSAPSYRRNVLRWIARARRPATRAQRIETTATLAGEGRRVLQL